MSRAGIRRRAIVGGTWLATTICASLLVAAGQIGFGGSASAGFTLVFVALAFDIVVFASVGAVLTIRRPENAVGMVLMAAGLLIGLAFLGYIGGAVLTATRGVDDLLAGLLSLLGALGVDPALIAAGPLLALLFPDGRLPGPRWRRPVGAIAVAVVISTVLLALQPGPVGEELANNPLGVTGVPLLETLAPIGATLGLIALAAAFVLGVAAVVVRFRRSRLAEREQLKWFVAAIVLAALFLLLAIADGATDPTAFDVLGICSLSLLPMAIGVAILRYRLYEIDRIISRTLAYGAVTAALAGSFALASLVIGSVVGSQGAGETIQIAGATLVVLALFGPVRRRAQAIVDRRFDRSHYDAAQTIVALTQRLRQGVDLDRLETEVLGVLVDTFHPTETSVWLRSRSGSRSSPPVTIPGRTRPTVRPT